MTPATLTPLTLTITQDAQAREWLCDCEWDDISVEEIMLLAPAQIRRAIIRLYDGGLVAFLATCDE